MARILVTGSAGFIGSHFIDHTLQTTDHEVVALDGMTYAADLSRLTDLPAFDTSRVKVLWHDLRSPLNEGLVKEIGEVDWVVNFASDSHVDRSITDPVPFVMNNVSVVLNMLEYARLVEPEQFIQISTDEVYGDVAVGASKEWDCIRPSNPYSGSKAAQEAIAYSYWRSYSVPVVITNTMNNFGSRQHPEKFVPLVIRKILNNETINIHGSLNEYGMWKSGSRYWLHAKNHADAILFLLENHQPQMYPANDLLSRFNVVGDNELTNLEIVQVIEDILDKDAHITFEDFHSSRPGHDLRYALDGTKLALEGWKAPLALEESFRDTVEWFVANSERWLS